MKSITSDIKCTGCALCYNVCKHNAITMELNSEGFYFPIILANSCVDCNACVNICNRQVIKNYPICAYKALSKDKNVLDRSTSGGLFLEFAKKILEEGGVVFAAVFDDVFSVKHVEIDNFADLVKAQGSKYVGSNIEKTYLIIKQRLSENKKVAFFGTPCQCSALKKIMGSNNEDLYLIDFICHGIASEKVFKLFLRQLEENSKSTISEFYFRSKDFGYLSPKIKIKYKNDKLEYYPTYDCSFGYAFAAGIINRKACASCEFSTIERISDITMADLTTSISENEKKLGASLCLINTRKGLDLFNNCDLNKEEKTLEFCKQVQYHLTTPAIEDRRRSKLFSNIDKMPYNLLAKKFMTRPKNNLINKIKTKLSYIFRRK